MNQPTAGFTDVVRKAWGNPERIAKIGINESFEHSNVFGFDHDDQVNNATKIGVLAGMTADKGPDAFIKGFTELLNNEE